MSLADQPAFPRPYSQDQDGWNAEATSGMTYRQWLVGMALQGLLANPGLTQSVGVMMNKGVIIDALPTFVTMAVNVADAAVKAQEK